MERRNGEMGIRGNTRREEIGEDGKNERNFVSTLRSLNLTPILDFL